MVTFIRNGMEVIGSLLDDNRVVDLKEAYILFLLSEGKRIDKALEGACKIIPGTMKEFLEKSETLAPVAQKAIDYVLKVKVGKAVYNINEIRLKTPVPNPGKIIIMGNAWRLTENMTTHGFKPITSLIGPDEPIIIGKNHSEVFYENELGVVVGKRCKYLRNEDDTYDSIAGYTIYNDVTDIGFQREVYELDENGKVKTIPGKGRVYKPYPFPESYKLRKMLDTYCPIGPCITLKDQIEDPHNLLMKARVNGKPNERWPERSTSEMKVPVWKYVAFCSKWMTLEPGDIITTGGAISGAIKPGDIVELEIEKVGVLRNPVIAEK